MKNTASFPLSEIEEKTRKSQIRNMIREERFPLFGSFPSPYLKVDFTSPASSLGRTRIGFNSDWF